MNNKINIIIIDSGVKITHKNFDNELVHGYEFSPEGISEKFEDEYGHGTAIYNIVKECNNYANITNVKLKGISEGVDETVLCDLLQYIYMHEKADIINLSLGLDICENINKLEEIVKKITSLGTIIISAFDNTGSISYPAAFKDVIGVTTGKYCSKIDDFEYIEDEVINIAAKGNLQRLAWTEPEYIVLEGNSFACAHVTVQVAKLMNKGYKTKKDILCKLKETSIKQYNLNSNIKTHEIFKIKKAALFPFNKEMHSLLRYRNLLNFEIIDVYDSKYSAKVGATTSHLMKDNDVKCITIKNINDIDWDSIDTLILGHTHELAAITGQNNIKNKLVTKAINLNKKIYSFDDLSEFENENIFYPKIDENNLPPKRCGMLYRISKPVVGVFGTSSKQGKFTLQLKLRELLLSKGYNVGQIGTEPSALLYQMDYCFPMGYNSSVYIKEFDTIRYLNYIMNDLCSKNKDIILVGSQSGTIPYDTGNIIQYTTPQFNFLLGTQPDCVILCVNPFDNIDYIHRTINFIESIINARVISIVIFPMDLREGLQGILGSKIRITDTKYNKIKNIFESRFKIPIFKLGSESDMDCLIEELINYFS